MNKKIVAQNCTVLVGADVHTNSHSRLHLCPHPLVIAVQRKNLYDPLLHQF